MVPERGFSDFPYSQTPFITTREGFPLQLSFDWSCLSAHAHCHALLHVFSRFSVDWLVVSRGRCDKRGMTVFTNPGRTH